MLPQNLVRRKKDFLGSTAEPRGSAPTGCAGRRDGSVSASGVAAFPRAKASAVGIWRARESCPRRTLAQAAARASSLSLPRRRECIFFCACSCSAAEWACNLSKRPWRNSSSGACELRGRQLRCERSAPGTNVATVGRKLPSPSRSLIATFVRRAYAPSAATNAWSTPVMRNRGTV